MLENFAANHESRIVMLDRAWRWFFGKQVEETEREIIMLALIAQQCEGNANMTNMIAAITLVFKCSAPTARKKLKPCIESGFLEYKPDMGNANGKMISVPTGVKRKIERIEKLIPLIMVVVQAQARSPSDLTAGIKYLTDKEYVSQDFSGIYFNAHNPDTMRVLQNNILEKAKEIREEKKS